MEGVKDSSLGAEVSTPLGVTVLRIPEADMTDNEINVIDAQCCQRYCWLLIK